MSDDIVEKLTESLNESGYRILKGNEAAGFFKMMDEQIEKTKKARTPRYRYESKYQFPDDVDLFGSKEMDPEGFRNSTHLSVSRGMEYLEDKHLDGFVQKEIPGIFGVTDDNKMMEELKDHINSCVMKELGRQWGHSGFSMSLAAGHVLKAKSLGWDKYIEYVRGVCK